MPFDVKPPSISYYFFAIFFSFLSFSRHRTRHVLSRRRRQTPKWNRLQSDFSKMKQLHLLTNQHVNNNDNSFGSMKWNCRTCDHPVDDDDDRLRMFKRTGNGDCNWMDLRLFRTVIHTHAHTFRLILVLLRLILHKMHRNAYIRSGARVYNHLKC